MSCDHSFGPWCRSLPPVSVPTMAGWRSASCAASEVTGWAPDLSAKGGAEGACRLIADRGRNGLQGERVPLEHGFGQGHAPIHRILHRRHPDLLAELLAEDRAGNPPPWPVPPPTMREPRHYGAASGRGREADQRAPQGGRVVRWHPRFRYGTAAPPRAEPR